MTVTDIPIRSGNTLIDSIFDLCVRFLLWLADILGVSYYTINIWIFCIIWPLLTIALIILIAYQRRKISKLINLNSPDIAA